MEGGFVLFCFSPIFLFYFLFIHVGLAFSEGPSQTQVSTRGLHLNSHLCMRSTDTTCTRHMYRMLI